MKFSHLMASFLPPSTQDARATDLERIEACRSWFRSAHTGSGDGGIAACYDPVRGRWFPSYPETSGYIIPTLLNIAGLFGDQDSDALALSIGTFLLSKRNQDGAISHWKAGTAKPVVFDTGQVLFGWLALWQHFRLDEYLLAARRAGDWLVSHQDLVGGWSKFQHLNVKKTIDTRVAWSLLELFKETGDERYRQGAMACLNWVLTCQDVYGWYHHASFTLAEDPFTHTIVYTAEGLMESGLILGDERYIAAAKKTADALLRLQRKNGSLYSTYAEGWRSSAVSVCLTGLSQAARLWMQFYERTQDTAYLVAAERALEYLRQKQKVQGAAEPLRGALAGSSPFFGVYERFKYPNWATKFLADTFMTKEMLAANGVTVLKYKG